LTDFKNNPLGLLNRIYRFDGGLQGLSRMDLAGQIQPVHDLSREAELGSRGVNKGGFIQIGETLTNDTAAGATIFASRDIYASLDSVGVLEDFSSRFHRLWLMDAYGVIVADANEGNWTETRAGIKFQDPAVRVQLWRHWNLDINPLASGEDRPMIQNESQLPAIRPPTYLPFSTSATLLQAAALSSNDCICRVNWQLWAGPIGTTPPGMR